MCVILLSLCLCVSSGTVEPKEAYDRFVAYFSAGDNAAPDFVQVKGVKLDGDHLTVNVSKHILNYGGNANEQALIDELTQAASTLVGIEYLTLLIEGEFTPLPEGRSIDRLTLYPKSKSPQASRPA